MKHQNMCVFQYAPTNKLLYAKDIPKFKQEVKSYYKQIRDQTPIIRSEFKSFLLEESKVTFSAEYTIYYATSFSAQCLAKSCQTL